MQINRGVLLPSSATSQDDSASKLYKGIEAHQVFSNSRYIFKITSTGDTMYRYRYNPKTNDTEERAILRRVQPYDSFWIGFQSNIVRANSVTGTSRVFFGKGYALYELFDKNNKRRGYKFAPRSMQSPPDRDCMYFELVKIEKLEQKEVR